MRRCGDCQLCCQLLPVRELAKGAGVKCRHQKFGKGCLVYHQPHKGFPPSCGLWNCAWLGDAEDTAQLSRPDRAHYVIDVMPDYVTLRPNDGSAPIDLPVIQIWLDPAFPDAHRDRHLRAYLAGRAEREGMAALVRLNNRDGFLLAAPAISDDGQWHEQHSGELRAPHTMAEIAEHVGGQLRMEIVEEERP